MSENKNHDHSDDIEDNNFIEINSPATNYFFVLDTESSSNKPSFLIEAVITRTPDCVIHIYPKDHNPPHFHALKNGESVGFSIETGKRLDGHKGLKGLDKKIKNYWEKDRCLLATKWNDLRPNNNSTGIFIIPAEWKRKD